MNEERFSKLEDSVERIEKALIGDEDMGNTGMVKRLHSVEKKTEEVEDGIKKFYTIGGTLSVIWGVVVAVVSIFKDHLFGKVH